MVVLGKCLSCCRINILLLARLSESPRNTLWGKVCPLRLSLEAEPACSNPPAGVDLRIYTGERHDFGTSGPWLIRASSLQGRAGSSMHS